MILEEIALRNWRQYREEHRFSFGEGIELLVGANEAGKSTLLEALTRGVFDRHTSRSAELKAIRPLGSSLGPEVRLTWRRNGRRLRIIKRFLLDPVSELLSERDGSFELDHEGDRADREARALFEAGDVRGVSKAQHRGLAQALWFLEREDPLPRVDWDRAVHGGLEALAQRGLQPEDERRLEEIIEREYSAIFTPKGRVSARSELHALQEEVRSLEAQAQHTDEQLGRLRRLALEMEEMDAQGPGIEEDLRAVRSERAVLAQRLESRRGREVEKEHAEAALQKSLTRRSELKAALSRLRRAEKRQSAVDDRLFKAREAQTSRVQTLETDHRALHELRKLRSSSLEPALERIGPELSELRTTERAEALRSERARLEEELGEVRALREQVDCLARQLAAERGPEPQGWRTLVAGVRRLAVLEVDASEAQVAITIEDLDEGGITAVPATSRDAGGVYRILRPTRFIVGNTTRFSVAPPRGERLLEIERLDQEVEELCLRYALKRETVIERFEERSRRLELLEIKRELLLAAEGREADCRKRLVDLGEELRQLEERSSQPLLPGVEEWTGERRRFRLLELEQERDRLQGALEAEQRKERTLEKRYLSSVEETRSRESELTKLVAESAERGSEVAAILQGHESRGEMEIEAERAQRAVVEARRLAARLGGDEVEELQSRDRKLASLEDELQERQRRLVVDSADRASRRDELSRLGLHARLGELEAELAAQRERLAASQEEAEAVRVLYEMKDAYKAGSALRLSEPIRETVSRWWSFLSAESYSAVTLGSRLLPGDVGSRRYETGLSLENLSYGAWEQVVVLVRLAIAVALSAEERQLVVLDDKLVHADPERMARFVKVLEEVGEHCQIVIATCNEASYDSLSAHRVVVPDSGRLCAP